ncbi:MAG: GatB/YqeY domain-containing protein [Candidatus Omnitrophica bacterium]|nr:GatB/YqeY domain-containing protein [Candidatus Omnitrophota bacterium]
MIEERINKEYIEAMKAKQKDRSSTLNFLRAQIKNLRIEKRVEKLEDKDVVAVIKKQVKQRQDSIEQYEKGGRKDLADKEKGELEILKQYLPEEMSAEQLEGIVQEAIKESGAQSMKEMGLVMKVIMPKVEGKADNKMVSELVKKGLTQL